MMPKELIPAGWVQKPCVFLLPESSPSADSCAQCEGAFSWWKNARSYCMFCGYFFHRHSSCSRKIQVEGEFFRQRICSRCHYYRTTASCKLRAGEQFECFSVESEEGGISMVNVSLSEETAELILEWKEKGVRETADLASVEIRKGFSHLHHHTHSGAGDYEPLKSFSLFLEDGSGGHSAHLLKASSALTCQLWVEGLKTAGYVYQRMLEQARAQAALHKEDSGGRKRSRQLYLPSASAETSADPAPLTLSSTDADLEEWEDIVSPVLLSMGSPSSLHAHSSSGYQSDLSLSLCSSLVPSRQSLTVHSLNLPSHHAPTPDWQSPTSARSLPPTPGLPAPAQHSSAFSLPPSASNNSPFSIQCPCHYKSSHLQKQVPSKCCEECQTACKIALELQNF